MAMGIENFKPQNGNANAWNDLEFSMAACGSELYLYSVSFCANLGDARNKHSSFIRTHTNTSYKHWNNYVFVD